MLKGHKKFLMKGNPPQSWPWKQNGTAVVVAAMILEVVNNWRSVLEKYFGKKVDFEPKSPSIAGKACYHYNSWVNCVYIVYMFDRNSGGKTSQIE